MSKISQALVPLAALAVALTAAPAMAQDVTADLNRITVDGVGEKVGSVVISSTGQGVSFQIEAQGIPAGEHGFHVHENGDCGPGEKDGKREAGLAAGEHYDPASTGSHKGPDGGGHKGDLPKLMVTGQAVSQAVSAPHLMLDDIRGRALIIHEGGDTYSDQPPSGGGEGRLFCAVVPAS